MIAEDVLGRARMVPRAHTIGANAVSGVYQLGGSTIER
jgi:hypothetical protein